MEASNTNQASGYINSYYAVSANVTPERARLEQNISTDICVIGAGFSGLSSALHPRIQWSWGNRYAPGG